MQRGLELLSAKWGRQD